MEPAEVLDGIEEEHKERSRLNAAVAVVVAILATFMGICNVKDGNIVQAMQQAQADKVDHWAWYQARKIRIDMGKATLATLAAMPSPNNKTISYYKDFIAKEDSKLKETQQLADKDQKTYDDFNFHDDQFDLAESALAIAISLMAVTSLTQKRWLFLVALVPTIFGLIMGIAGLFGWGIHPNALAKFLGT